MPSRHLVSTMVAAKSRPLLILLAFLGLLYLAPSQASPPYNQAVPGDEFGPQLGVVVRELTFDRLVTLGLEYGVQVVRVIPGSPGANSGIQPGDIIQAVDAKPVYSVPRLRWLIDRSSSQGSLDLTLIRENEQKTLRVDLAAVKPPVTEREITRESPPHPYLGIGMQPLTAELREAFKVPVNQGVLVSDVVPGSPAKEVGIKAGDVILKIDRRSISSKADVYRALNFFDPGDFIGVEIMRDGKPLQLQIKLGAVPERFSGDRERAFSPWYNPDRPHNPSHHDRWYRGMDQMLDQWREMWDEIFERMPNRGSAERSLGEI